MSPILGIFASQGRVAANSYESIQTVTPSGVGTFSFTSIPSTFKHLQIRYITRNNTAAYYVTCGFNGDTGTNYANHQLSGNGTVASAGGNASDTQIYLPRNSTTTPFFGAGIVDILDYTNTNKNKTVRSFGGYDQNGTGQAVDFNSGLWMNTSAITAINFSVFGGLYTSGSHFALYGIRG